MKDVRIIIQGAKEHFADPPGDYPLCTVAASVLEVFVDGESMVVQSASFDATAGEAATVTLTFYPRTLTVETVA